jgi:predicted enzyme related to lactoylglutathione lyase
VSEPEAGAIAWTDLTVGDAARIRDFYREVAGWTVEPIPMGGYEDFVMKDASGRGVAGVCHASGVNADLPPQWLMYVLVDDVDAAAARAVALGGSIVRAPRAVGGGRMCVIRDPAGAVLALYRG